MAVFTDLSQCRGTSRLRDLIMAVALQQIQSMLYLNPQSRAKSYKSLSESQRMIMSPWLYGMKTMIFSHHCWRQSCVQYSSSISAVGLYHVWLQVDRAAGFTSTICLYIGQPHLNYDCLWAQQYFFKALTHNFHLQEVIFSQALPQFCSTREAFARLYGLKGCRVLVVFGLETSFHFQGNATGWPNTELK